MAINKGILGNEVSYTDRAFRELKKLQEWVSHARGIHPEMVIVLTSGSFDMLHIGHLRYLNQARSHGDILIVGVDNDAKIKQRKGPARPIVPEDERMEMLAYQRPVDALFLKQASEQQWALIKAVKPNVLVVTKGTYKRDELKKLREQFNCKVVILPPQAEATTSARIRTVYMQLAEMISARLEKDLPGLGRKIVEEVLEGGGEK